MKNKSIIALAATATLLYGCLGPQTYFSEVFNTVYDLYFPVQDSANKPVMNYKVSASIIENEDRYDYTLYFFETGMSLTAVSPIIISGASTTETIEAIFDYEEEGVFASRYTGSMMANLEKVFTTLDEADLDIVTEAIEIAEVNLTEDILSIINNQATNLIIGGQPVDQDSKTYNIPVAQFVDLTMFEDLVGFVPVNLTVSVNFVTSENAATIEVSASSESSIYEVSITLEDHDQINAEDHLLSASEKLAYEGYVA
jgi:hypothetical protein